MLQESQFGSLSDILLYAAKKNVHLENRVLDILASELSNYLSRFFDAETIPVQESLKRFNSNLVYLITQLIMFYKQGTDKISNIDEILVLLTLVSSRLIMGGMKKKEIIDIRNRIERARDRLANLKTEKIEYAKEPWSKNPKSTLVYELATTLVEAFPGLSQRKAVQVVAILLIEFEIESDKRVRKPKVLVPKVDPVVTRLEKRLTRFKQKFGTPDTFYSSLSKRIKAKRVRTE